MIYPTYAAAKAAAHAHAEQLNLFPLDGKIYLATTVADGATLDEEGRHSDPCVVERDYLEEVERMEPELNPHLDGVDRHNVIVAVFLYRSEKDYVALTAWGEALVRSRLT